MPKTTKIVKQTEPGTPLSKEMLSELKDIERVNGLLHIPAIIERAQDQTNPLHSYFEWDDNLAAERYRLQQAYQLVLRYRIVIQGKEVAAFMRVKVKVKNEEVTGYLSAEKVLSNDELHHQVLEEAIRDLEYWKLKYENLQELKPVVDTQKLASVKKKLKLLK